ncbi:MAG TPA: ABC transporter permease [Candidatus Tectomicrobia bacterium]
MQYAAVPTEGLREPVYQFEGNANLWSDWRKTVTLVKHLTRRHLAARYRGSALGFLWSLLNPMLLMGVYTFVFAFIFRTAAPDVPYSVFLITGLLAWNFVSTAAMNAAVSLVDGAPLLKKTAFPLFVLPVSAVLSNAVNYLITLPLLIIFNLLSGIAPTLSLLLFPCMLLLLLLVALGVGLLLAALMPFFRDLQQLIEVLFTMWFFLTPVLYPMSLVSQNLPAWFLSLYELNPMVGTMHLVHTVFLGQPLPGTSVVVALGGMLCFLGLGLWVFQRLAMHASEV